MPIAGWDKSNSKTCPRPPSLAAALAFHLNGIASLYFQAASGVSIDRGRDFMLLLAGVSEARLQKQIFK